MADKRALRNECRNTRWVQTRTHLEQRYPQRPDLELPAGSIRIRQMTRRLGCGHYDTGQHYAGQAKISYLTSASQLLRVDHDKRAMGTIEAHENHCLA